MQVRGGLPVWRQAAELSGRYAECGVLDRLVEAVGQAGESRALVVHGEVGVGKTALLEYLAGHAPGCRVARAAGVQSEMELAFAGLHQLCAPMLDRLDALPAPQRDALRTAFGMCAGPAPDRFLIGLAVLSLLSQVAEQKPLVCLVDDGQWLDHASAQVLGFVARRLGAESVGLVFAARAAGGDLAKLPEMAVRGLPDADARALLDSVLTGRIDGRVRDQIVAETRGNPLALLELPRGLTPAELAGGFGLPGAVPLAGSIEDSFRRRVIALPHQTRRLLLLAAADPVGDPALMWRSAARLGIGAEAAAPAADAGLAEFGPRMRFRHPLARSAAYRCASPQERQEAHRALADATDYQLDPDRRAWHRAQASPGPDEEVAAELDHCAGRAQARGGLAAAAAFLERAALMTPDPVRGAQRMFAAAGAQRDAGALDSALGLLAAAQTGPLDALRMGEVERLRGQIALDQRRGRDAARLLLRAARLLEPLDTGLARETYLEALWEAAMWAGDLDIPGGVREVAEAALAAPSAPDPPRAVDVLLDALAIRLIEGHAAAALELTRAVQLVLALDIGTDEAGHWLWLAGGRVSQVIALELWDFESWHALATRQAQFARGAGALAHLQFALNYLARAHLLAGDLHTVALMIEEDRVISEATGNPTVAHNSILLAAWQGHEGEAAELIESTMHATTGPDQGRLAAFASSASAVLYNGLSRYYAACDAAERAFELDQLGYGPLVVPELAEAAARTGDVALVRAALEWMSERTRVIPTDWAMGIEARIRALLAEGDAAGGCYRESIERLARTRIRAQLGRAYLLYGEWLRRERRPSEAREQLRTAHGMFEAMGMEAFAERANRELLAAGGTIRKRTQAARHEELTAQEAQVARLAREGLSNPEIGARLFISAHTVQYHLRKVFTKLGITSRSQLDRVLPSDSATVQHAR